MSGTGWSIKRVVGCVDCATIFPVRREIGDTTRCRPCRQSEAKRRHYALHPEAYALKLEAEKERFKQKTPEQLAAKKARDKAAAQTPEGRILAAKRVREYYAREVAKDPDFHKKQYWPNRDRCIQNTVNSKFRHITPAWADMAAIEKIYAMARELSDATGHQYHVDHIIPVKGRNVNGLHVETNLRVLSAYANTRKGNKLTEAVA